MNFNHAVIFRDRDEQIARLTVQQKQSTHQAEQAIEDYKKQVRYYSHYIILYIKYNVNLIQNLKVINDIYI